MTIYHVHHIIPRHLGGTDDPSNLVKLTIEEHAEAHRLLYEQHGRWEDKCAWLGLSGQASKAEIIKVMLSEAGRKGGRYKRDPNKKLSESHKANLSKAKSGANHPMYGKHHSDESKRKKSEATKGIPKPIVTCPHCGKVGGKNTMGRWHFDKCKLNPGS
jgi:hypothetical protein